MPCGAVACAQGKGVLRFAQDDRIEGGWNSRFLDVEDLLYGFGAGADAVWDAYAAVAVAG